MEDNSFLATKLVPGKSLISKPHHHTGLVFLLCLMIIIAVFLLMSFRESKPDNSDFASTTSQPEKSPREAVISNISQSVDTTTSREDLLKSLVKPKGVVK